MKSGTEIPTDWTAAIEAWSANLRDQQRAESTVRGYAFHLRRVARELGGRAPDPGALHSADLARWLSGQDWSPVTVRKFCGSLRRFYGWALDERLYQHSPLDDLPVPPPRKPGPPPQVPAAAPWVVLARQWRDYQHAAGKSSRTITLQAYYLGRLAADIPDVLGASVDDLTGWMHRHDWSPNTRRSARSALRSFYRWAVLTGRLSESPAQLLPPVRVPRSLARPLAEADYQTARTTSQGPVSLAIRLAGTCGMRRGEIARARRDDLTPDDAGGRSLRVIGKGGHVRVVPLPADLAGEVAAAPPGWLFPSPVRPGQHLTAHHLAKLIARQLPAGTTTHQLRHRAATAAYRGTRDLRAVQELLGHAQPTTTAGYVQTSQHAIRAAMMAAAD